MTARTVLQAHQYPAYAEVISTLASIKCNGNSAKDCHGNTSVYCKEFCVLPLLGDARVTTFVIDDDSP